MKDIFRAWNLHSVYEPRSKIALRNTVLLGLLSILFFSGVRGNLTTWVHVVRTKVIVTQMDYIGVLQLQWLSKKGQGHVCHHGSDENLAPGSIHITCENTFEKGQLKRKDLIINHERINNKNIDFLGFLKYPKTD